MAEKKKAAAPKKKGAVAAREEKAPKPKSVKVWGLELKLPESLPATFMFDIAEMQENPDALTVIRTLTSFLGREQVAEIRAKVARGEVSDEQFVEFLGDVLTACMEPFGMDLGEAEASPTP